jgi:Fe-S cluster assembly ATP-binding protein
MSTLRLENIHVHAGDKEVVRDVSMNVQSGELHVILGPNGSGKSSLLNGLMGHPKYQLAHGAVFLDEEEITTLPTEKKAQKGILLSLQHVPEIPGVTLTNFLHRSYRALGKGELAPLPFYKELEARAMSFQIDPSFLKKPLNAGLSGGEKKQSEVLQLLALRPTFALLDEIDSGVDVDALRKVFRALEVLRQDGTGIVMVTHFANLLAHVTPDVVHVMSGGRIMVSGGRELVEQIMEKGYEGLI